MSDNVKGRYLGDRLVARMRGLIDGNQAAAKEIVEQALRVDDVTINVTANWEFRSETSLRSIAGNAAVDGSHFGYDQNGFDLLTNQRTQDARDNIDLRYQFTQRLALDKSDALQWAAKDQVAWDFGEHSMCRKCNPCGGSGQVNCYGCGGSGSHSCSYCGGAGSTTHTRTVGYGSQMRQERYSQSCNTCFASGRVRCGTCGGNGQLRCDSCVGNGFFTDLMRVTALAVPHVDFQTDTSLSNVALCSYLVSLGVAETASHLTFSALAATTTENNKLQAQFVCRSLVVEVDFILRGQHFCAAAVGEEPLAFVRPPMFDLVFIEELRALEGLYSHKNGLTLNKRKAVKFFAAYRGQPVLDQALQSVARIAHPDRATDKPGLAVQVACDGFISNTSAAALGTCMVRMVDRVSPAYSAPVWILVVSFCLFVSFFSGESALESTQGAWYWYVLALLERLLNAVLLVLLLSPIAWLFSSVVSFFQRRFIPKAYRQAPRNWQPLSAGIAAAIFATLLGAGYGSLASYGWLPRWNGGPERWADAQWRAHKPYLINASQWVASKLLPNSTKSP